MTVLFRNVLMCVRAAYLLSGLSLIILAGVTFAQAEPTNEPTAEPSVEAIVKGEIGHLVDDYVSPLVEGGFAGTLLVVHQGDVVLRQAYGEADSENGIPNTVTTVHHIGSISKTYTQAAVLKLVDDGLLDLDAPITDYLDDVPEDKAAVTARQLLQHTAGFPHALAGDPFEVLTRDEALDAILALELVSAPGEGEVYSNPGYTLLAALVEVISGQSFESYVREQFLTPLGMDDTFFVGEDVGERLVGHITNDYDGYGSPADWPGGWKLMGAGTMLSTVDDLHRFHLGTLTDPFLSRYFSPVGGVGVAGGATFARFSADFEYIAPLDLVIVGLSNGDDHLAEALIVDELLPLLVDTLRGG